MLGEPGEVQRAEGVEALRAGGGEAHVDAAGMLRVALAHDLPGADGAVDEPDDAVVAQQQGVGELGQGRAAGLGCARTASASWTCAGVVPCSRARCSAHAR